MVLDSIQQVRERIDRSIDRSIQSSYLAVEHEISGLLGIRETEDRVGVTTRSRSEKGTVS